MNFFNNGYMCTTCGPIHKAKKATRNKVQVDTCTICGKMVSKWVRPLKERSGRCGNCGHGAFKQAIVKGQFLRCCKKCEEVFNVDTNKVVRNGGVIC